MCKGKDFPSIPLHLANKLCLFGSLQCVNQRILVQIARLEHSLKIELTPDDGSQPQRLLGTIRESAHARLYSQPHTLR